MALQPPPENWISKKLGRDEKIWTYIMIVMLLMMGIFATGYVFAGDQNPPEQYRQVPVEDYEQYAIDGNMEAGATPTNLTGTDMEGLSQLDGGHIYMIARTFEWQAPTEDRSYNAIQIRLGETYQLHLGSIDNLHGFQLIGTDFLLSIQVVPGYDYIVDFIPRETGTFRIICNEYCGTGHHTMMGMLEVVA